MRTASSPQQLSVSLTKAVADSPVLAHLSALLEQSKQRMIIVESLLPIGLRKLVTPGPADEGTWCLLVRSGAAACKLRQILPDLEARLQHATGNAVKIRVKVLSE